MEGQPGAIFFTFFYSTNNNNTTTTTVTFFTFFYSTNNTNNNNTTVTVVTLHSPDITFETLRVHLLFLFVLFVDIAGGLLYY